jgi:hypothetical protein
VPDGAVAVATDLVFARYGAAWIDDLDPLERSICLANAHEVVTLQL